MMIQWENFRQSDLSLDLVGVLLHLTAARKVRAEDRARAITFLDQMVDLSPITSRQAGAIAIAHALEIALKGAQHEVTHSFPPVPRITD